MPDAGTGLTIGASAIAAANALRPTIDRVLGPTADYLGDGMQAWSERTVENMSSVFHRAERKLGPDRIDGPSAVPPRVIKAVLEEAPFAEDELMAEYLGGVLASSRTENGRDDRAASLAAMVSRLSTYQLRTHYIFYALAQRSMAGWKWDDINFDHTAVRQKHGRVYIPTIDFALAMDLSPDECRNISDIWSHCRSGLDRENLLALPNAAGPPDQLKVHLDGIEPAERGMVVTLTLPGVELFCTAHAVRPPILPGFANPSEEFAVDADIKFGDGFRTITELTAERAQRSRAATD